MEELARKYAVQNAVIHGGKAQEKAVLGKVLQERPELRGRLDQVRKAVAKAIKDVNSLSPEEQAKMAEGYKIEERPSREGLPEIKVKGQLVTRFAPAPTGPLHILQVLRAVLIGYLYAKKYRGKFLLRFEDTDPKVVESQFYDMIREDLRSLEVEWDEEFIQSDYMELYYKDVEGLLEKGKVFVCFCDSKDFQVLKAQGKDCPCRWQRPDKNLLGWKGMLAGRYREGKAVVRLRTSMQEPNPALRDPPLLRVVEASHPLKGDKYRVWPLYNFANAVMDSYNGVTHVFRGKEHEVNTHIQKRIYQALNLKGPEVVNFGMVHLPGEKVHKSDIRKGIRAGQFNGWDDLRLPTVRSFIRRGFSPQAFKEFAIVCGLSKTDIEIDLSNLEAINRKVIDRQADRYMVVTQPEEIDISGILEKTGMSYALVKNHPEREDARKVAVTKKLFVSGEDFRRFHGREVRLIDLFNVVLDKKSRLAKSQEFDMKTPKIQWVSRKVDVRILYPREEVKVVGEEALGKARIGQVIQMVRIGFGRVEKPGVVIFGHK